MGRSGPWDLLRSTPMGAKLRSRWASTKSRSGRWRIFFPRQKSKLGRIRISAHAREDHFRARAQRTFPVSELIAISEAQFGRHRPIPGVAVPGHGSEWRCSGVRILRLCHPKDDATACCRQATAHSPAHRKPVAEFLTAGRRPPRRDTRAQRAGCVNVPPRIARRSRPRSQYRASPLASNS